MRRILCLAVVLSAPLMALGGPALAGMSEGVAAVTVGDYAKAIAEFQPLAAGGDPAAQYQLAKIYLEGRGPADGLPQGLDLMNKAASGGYPEAQAQLGLMYAMGLGLPVDNVLAYDWLSKAVTALPDGTRRTVAEANRDAVLKRMNASQQAAVAAKPVAPAKPVQEAASKPAATTTATAVTTAKPAATPAKPAATETTAKTTTANAAAAAPAKPAATETTAKTATANAAAAAPAKPAATEAPAKTPEKTVEKAVEKPAQVASAEPAKADPAAKPTGVRVQLASLPSEAAAWDAWKQISGKYSAQLTGLTAMVESADLGTKGTFYRVQTGPFATVAAAQERCGAMKAAGLDCLVVGKP
jgi:hypothetical protein